MIPKNRHPWLRGTSKRLGPKSSRDESPGKKSGPLTRLLDDMSKETYGRERSRCIVEEQCVSCGHRMELHKLAQECVDEFRISGLCPGCFEDVFKYYDEHV